MVNAHSHAFQRDLRGTAERPAPEAHAADDFWSWREAMYRLAGEHDPDSMRAAAARVYEEMAAAGYGAVGEFHYVHHRPDGTPYDDPNAMAIAVAEAARAAGLTITLLPAAYHRAGWDGADLRPTTGQRRFCDQTVEDYLERVDALRAWAAPRPGVRVGVAAHSIRAVPASWLEAIAAYADEHALVRHVHASEQPREVEGAEGALVVSANAEQIANVLLSELGGLFQLAPGFTTPLGNLIGSLRAEEDGLRGRLELEIDG
jgi:formiminoglutamate deiminase